MSMRRVSLARSYGLSRPARVVPIGATIPVTVNGSTYRMTVDSVAPSRSIRRIRRDRLAFVGTLPKYGRCVAFAAPSTIVYG